LIAKLREVCMHDLDVEKLFKDHDPEGTGKISDLEFKYLMK
jgi:hypothetical protein